MGAPPKFGRQVAGRPAGGERGGGVSGEPQIDSGARANGVRPPARRPPGYCPASHPHELARLSRGAPGPARCRAPPPTRSRAARLRSSVRAGREVNLVSTTSPNRGALGDLAAPRRSAAHGQQLGEARGQRPRQAMRLAREDFTIAFRASHFERHDPSRLAIASSPDFTGRPRTQPLQLVEAPTVASLVCQPRWLLVVALHSPQTLGDSMRPVNSCGSDHEGAQGCFKTTPSRRRLPGPGGEQPRWLLRRAARRRGLCFAMNEAPRPRVACCFTLPGQ